MVKINIEKSVTWGNTHNLFVSFPFDSQIITIIKAMPYRYWRADQKCWEIAIDSLPDLIDKLKDFEIEINLENANILNCDNATGTETDVSDFKFKTNPFSHQIDGFKYGMTHKRWLLGDEQGCGKTKQVIDIATAKKATEGYKHCLIICGVNGLKWNWVEEIKVHSDENAWIIGQKTKGNQITIGSTQEKHNQLQMLIDNADCDIANAYFLITNVESLRNDDIVNQLSYLCANKIIGMVAADEVHKMKNPQSRQGKGFLKIQADTMIAMTGTPLMNTPLDLYIILKWLKYENHTFYSFKNHYCVMGGFGNYQIIGYKHLDALQNQLNTIMLRRLKSDVLDLPEKTYVNEYVEMSAKQKQLYSEIRNSILANIDKVKMSSNPLAEMIRLRQVTGYTGILSSTIKESAKLDRMEELVEDAIENGKKVVIFSNWSQMTSAICDRLRKKYSIGLITGETPDSNRQTTVNLYQEGKLDVIIGTIGAMGTGLTLTAGTVEIFMDHPWNKALYDQAIDRCHRIGQHHNITIYNLLTKDTIDERIWELVQQKGALSTLVVDGEHPADKAELVDYLLS